MKEVIELLENIAKYHCTCNRSWPRAGRHDDSCLVYRANKALSLLRQQPEAGEFTKRLRFNIAEYRKTGEFGSLLLEDFEEALNLLDRQAAELARAKEELKIKDKARLMASLKSTSDKCLAEKCEAFTHWFYETQKCKAELSSYRKNFCEAHQPLPEDTYKGCYCCDLIHLTEENARLKKQIIELKTQLLGGSENDSCAIEGMDEARAVKDKLAGRQNVRNSKL